MKNEVKIEIDGLDQVTRRLQRMGKDADKVLYDAVNATALEVNTDVKKRIKRGPKSGVTYWRIPGEDGLMRVYAGKPSDFGPNKIVAVFRTDGKANLSPSHTASAPGEAPATDTGTLAGSIYHEKTGKTQVTIGSRLKYARYLEFGTTKIRPRPAWQPASVEGQKKLMKRVRKALGEVTK